VHADALGSVRKVTDSAGIAVATIDYDSWGNEILSAETLGPLLSLRFVGSLGTWTDMDMDLLYMRERWYSPDLAGFLSRDKVRSQNSYWYANGNPASLVDPTGLDIAIIVGQQREGSINVFGHVAIAIEGHGVFSFGTETPPGTSISDYLADQTPFRDNEIFIFQTSKKQDEAAHKRLKEMADDLNSLSGDTCATRTNGILKDYYGFDTEPPPQMEILPWHARSFPSIASGAAHKRLEIFGGEVVRIPQGFQGPLSWSVKFQSIVPHPSPVRR